MTGDADLSAVAELIADRARSKILLALASGRELSAGVLAEEAGISRSTASAHLRKLTEGRLIAARTDGRNRHFRIAGPEVAGVLERLMELAPPEPITSLRGSTRAAQLRRARTCYDHLAGRLGVGIMQGMLQRGYLIGGNGVFDPDDAVDDHPAAHGHDLDYRVTDDGEAFLRTVGVQIPDSRRPLVRYCIDWTETRHHLAGRLGRGIRDRFLEAGWVQRGATHRALKVTAAGETVLERDFGLVLQS
ncbi:helix-turn-helix transcriptional regulator [Microlunatus sp. Gsoil 973]|uniref:ArsR/SmtB family transcription factor n=1 Tax=Microlunatus sp. Gsoil 973 TaxID=2672569 RepID=UPI0012B4FBDC|nr:helix-turn-helix domain-containing protein [Microlunatus sp. Gsoil 973]QGN31742.1 metalloregulator ArsR/SmtB family transcription factor [Microlunatus sp. Gsoil 973]